MTHATFSREFSGESVHVEFKTGISAKLARALVAFSNTDGGVVFIGVRPDGSVQGVKQPGEVERQLRDQVVNVRNPGRFQVRQLVVDGLDVLVLCIARRREGFAQSSEGVIYQRLGARNEPLVGAELSRFVQQHAFNSFESMPTAILYSSVTSPSLDRVATAYQMKPKDLRNRLLDDEFLTWAEGDVVLTVAGALILLESSEKELGRSGVEILRYSDRESEPDKRHVITGTVDHLVRQCEQHVRDQLGRQTVMLGIQRVGIDRLPPVALRESIANAIAHRSYEASGTYVRIEIRHSGVTIRSPGSLPEPVTMQTLREQQAARNPKVLSFLRRVGLAEDLGRGIDRIEDEMAAGLLDAPTFAEGSDWFEVSLRLSGNFAAEERAWVIELGRNHEIKRKDALLVVHASRIGTISNVTAREWLGCDREEARHALQRLRDVGVLEQSGQRGGARYRLAPSLGLPSTRALSRVKQKQVISELAAQEPVSNQQVRERLGIDRLQAVRLLSEMLEEGLLRRTGEKRGTRYHRVG